MRIEERTLFDDPVEAILEQVEENASPAWITEAERIIRALVPGTRFIGEQIVEMVASRGYVTHDTRAMGPVIRRLAGEHVITKTDQFRPAKSSHGAPKAVWEKVRT